MTPKVKPGELVDALSYTKVLAAVAAILAAMMREQLALQTRRVDDMQTPSRGENLVLKGIPVMSYAERGSVSFSAQDGHTPASYQAVENTVIAF